MLRRKAKSRHGSRRASQETVQSNRSKEVHGPEAKMNAYGTALVLLIIVIVVYGLAGIVRNHYKKKLRW